MKTVGNHNKVRHMMTHGEIYNDENKTKMMKKHEGHDYMRKMMAKDEIF